MFSIVIPTLNEAATLPRQIPRLQQAASRANVEMEIIVSDCRSRDETRNIARKFGAHHILDGATCRADALNRGAAVARGDVLVFLHADSRLPDDFPRLIARALARPEIVGGAFDFQLDPPPETDPHARWNAHALRWVVLLNRLRFRWTYNFYGDQTIFVRRTTFDAIGGFPRIRLMEDIRFARAMKRRGRVAILRPPVHTSPRRFLAHGVVRQLVTDMVLLSYESCGVTPEQLWNGYNHWNHAVGSRPPSVAPHDATFHRST